MSLSLFRDCYWLLVFDEVVVPVIVVDVVAFVVLVTVLVVDVLDVVVVVTVASGT